MTIEESVNEIKRFASRELSLLHEQHVKQKELGAAESQAGDEYLESSATRSIGVVIQIKAEVDAIDRALVACRAKRLAAVKQRHDADVADLRTRADTTRQQIAEIAAKAQPHLDALLEIEGVGFKPVAMAQSSRMRSVAESCEAKAGDLERHGIAAGGSIQLDGALSPHDIALAVLEFAADGPTGRAILNWVETLPDHESFADHKLSVRLNWSDAQITGNSYVTAHEPLRPEVVPPVEQPTPIRGRLSVDAALGYSAKPHYNDEAEEQSA